MKKIVKDNTIVDIAERLNISIATVSRALSDFPYVKESTREKVRNLAKEIGYQRNTLASGLRSKRTKTVGLIVPKISMYFQSLVTTAIQNRLYENGYNLLICQSNDNPEIEQQLINTLYNAQVDAVIVSCTLTTQDFSHFDKFVGSNIPIVFYDRVPTTPYPAVSIVGDDYGGAYKAIQELIDHGCKNIGYITGPQSCYLYQKRTEGAMAALKENGIELQEGFFISNNLTYEEGYAALEKLYASKKPLDAVFMSNDTCAIAALTYARDHNIRVPEDLKIVGYSNDPRTAITTPSISTVDQNPDQIGNLIVAELLKQLKSKEKLEVDEKGNIILKYPEPIVVPVQYINRDSSK